MNDRFKFRIWDKPTSQMFDTVCLGNISYAIKQPWVCADTPEGQIDYVNERLKDIVIMQCTGLKDKNGKLIYEGDIVKIPDDYDTYGQFAGEKREIYFNQGFRLAPKWDVNHRGNWLEDTEDFEIIGNIYENADLFEE